MKKTFKIIGYCLIGLLLALLIVPFVFKDQIIEGIKEAAEENLKADLEFSDVSLSLLRSFPSLNIQIHDLKITGHPPFEGKTLIATEKATLNVNISPLFNKKEEASISYIEFLRPEINILILNDSSANYDIVLPSESEGESEFKLKLDDYKIIGGNIKYDDLPLVMHIALINFDHQGSADISSNAYALSTKTHIEKLSYRSEGFSYLNKVETDLQAKINIDLLSNTYTLKENKLVLNQFEIIGEGGIQLLDNDRMKINANFSSPNQNFSSLVSVLPYLSQFKTYNATGEASFNALISGLYAANLDPQKNIYPSINLELNINNARVQYPELPYPMDNISGNINVKAKEGNYDDLLVNVNNFNIAINQDVIRGDLLIDNNPRNGKVEGNLVAEIDLDNWKKSLPIESLELLEGNIASNLNFAGSMNDIISNNIENITTQGSFQLSNLAFKTLDNPSISVSNFEGFFDNNQLNVNAEEVLLGKSDLEIKGTINNPLLLLASNLNAQGEINITSDKLDLNEWLTEDVSTDDQPISESISIAESQIQNNKSTIKYNLNVNELLYENYKLTNTRVSGNLGLNELTSLALQTNMEAGDLSINGNIYHFYDYLYNNKTLKGEIELTSNQFNLDQFMAGQTQESDNASTESYFDVPENLDILITTQINNAVYNKININNIKGLIKIVSNQIDFVDLQAKMFGGDMDLNGFYNTEEGHPRINTKLNLSTISFNQAYAGSNTMSRLAPIVEFIQGSFNSILVFDGILDANMMPELSSLTSSGYLETYNGTIKNAPFLQQLGDKLGINALSDINLENTRNWFEITEGSVELKEQYFKFKDIEMSVSGTHQIDNDLNYVLNLKIPRALMSNSAIGRQAERGWSWIQTEAAKKGVGLSNGEFIDLKVEASGKLRNPIFKITPMGSSGKTLKEQAEDEINNKIEEAVDSIKIIVEQQKNQIKDTILSVAEEKIDSLKGKAQEKIDDVVSDVKDKATEIIESRVDSVLGENATDSLKSKALEIIKDKTGTDIDDIKKRLEDFNPFKKKKKG